MVEVLCLVFQQLFPWHRDAFRSRPKKWHQNIYTTYLHNRKNFLKKLFEFTANRAPPARCPIPIASLGRRRRRLSLRQPPHTRSPRRYSACTGMTPTTSSCRPSGAGALICLRPSAPADCGAADPLGRCYCWSNNSKKHLCAALLDK